MGVFLHRLSVILNVILLVFCVLQLVFYFSFDVFIGCSVSVVCLFMFDRYVLKEKVIKTRPVSFLAMVGVMMLTYFPPILTFLDGHAISWRLITPVRTFVWQFVYVLVIYLAFLFSARYVNNNNPLRIALKKIGYFTVISDRGIWMLGFIGVGARLYLLANQYTGVPIIAAGTVKNILLPFLLAPFCLLFKNLYCEIDSSKSYIGIGIYSIVVFVLGIMTNSRNAIVSIAMVVVLMAFLSFAICKPIMLKKIASMSMKRFVTIIVIAIVIVSVFTALSEAMLATRKIRADVDNVELLSQTIDAIGSDEDNRLDQYENPLKNNVIDNAKNTDDVYVSSSFFNRICNYVVVDQTIFYANRIGYNSEYFRNKEFIEKMIVILPDPILRILGFQLDKEDYAYSSMDFLVSLSFHNENRRSFLVGGDVGLGLAMFGYCFLIVEFLVYCVVFIYLDNLFTMVNNRVYIPIITLIGLYGFFYTFMAGNGIHGRFFMYLWAIPTGVFLKSIIVRIVGKYSRLVKVSF